MASLLKWAITHFAPVFIVTSPVTSYADQIYSINKSRSSAGFSLDIPLIMLIASLTKVFYWLGARYDLPLLFQASIMLVVQIVLLRVALLNRPPVGAQQPFAGVMTEGGYIPCRPWNFWQWRNQKPYWQFLALYTGLLVALQLLIGTDSLYVQVQGSLALGVEAILPLPQILENHKNRSCKGFRLSVLVNWMLGDFFKMSYFFMSEGGVPWAFKVCGIVQTACDAYLGVQYWMYGSGEASTQGEEKDIRPT